METVVTPVVPLASNFLVPNGTFFVELLAFAIILWLLAKFVIPPINRAMAARQDAIRKEFADLEEAKADAKAAEEEFRAQIADARHEAAGSARRPASRVRRSSRRCASRPRPRRPGSSSTPTRRSTPTASRRSPPCAPRSGAWPRSWPAGSSARHSTTRLARAG